MLLKLVKHLIEVAYELLTGTMSLGVLVLNSAVGIAHHTVVVLVMEIIWTKVMEDGYIL